MPPVKKTDQPSDIDRLIKTFEKYLEMEQRRAVQQQKFADELKEAQKSQQENIQTILTWIEVKTRDCDQHNEKIDENRTALKGTPACPSIGVVNQVMKLNEIASRQDEKLRTHDSQIDELKKIDRKINMLGWVIAANLLVFIIAILGFFFSDVYRSMHGSHVQQPQKIETAGG